MRLLAHVLTIVALLVTVMGAPARADTARPGKRIALVIGIDAYQNAPHLNNPVSDARAVGAALRSLNFEVTELFDPDERHMSDSVREFGIKSQDAEAALVYYAGHGVQVDRENYLLPADTKLARERDLLYEAMPLNLLLGEVSQASKIGIVLLDSCRNNPFVEQLRRSSSRGNASANFSVGLARVDNVPRNTLVAMATRADEVAADGTEHSPFAASIIRQLKVPGVELSLFFRAVHDDVLGATNNKQEPYVFSALGADPFYFHPRPPSRPPEIGMIKPLEAVDNGGPVPLGVPRPTDPDQNPLSVRILGLPRAGDIRIDGQVMRRNDSVPLDRFMTAMYQPDGRTLGMVGALDFLVEDGLGGSVPGNLPITIVPSHHPAIVEPPRSLRVYPVALGIVAPTSDQGDKLTVVIRTLPRGMVRNGETMLRVGDRLAPADLANLTFMAEPGFFGSAGILLYAVDNGRGDTVEGRIDIEVAGSGGPADLISPTAMWEQVRGKGNAGDIEAFQRLFPAFRPATPDTRVRVADATPAPRPPPPPPPPPRAPIRPPVAPPLPVSPPDAARVIGPIAMATPPPSPPSPLPSSMDGDGFRDCPTCPVMLRIVGGTFMMGQGPKLPETTPAHRVTIKPFAVGRFPVTISEWQACVADKGCKSMPLMATADPRVPVHNVSWDDADQYVHWLSRLTDHKYRLPTEAEWEYAARGGTTSRYWWGENMGVTAANCVDCEGQQNPHAPLPVDDFEPNPFGLVDALGGVAQWTADCWFASYQGAPADGSARVIKDCEKRVLRGGSFRNKHDDITVIGRNNYDQSVRYNPNGIRVARDLE